MGRIVNTYVMPHPPVIIPEIGRGDEKGVLKTINALSEIADSIKKDNPTTIIITTPHGPVFQDHVYISPDKKLSGDFGRFGFKGLKYEFENNIELIESIIKYAVNEGISAGGLEDGILKKYGISKHLDHGALVPLYFVKKEYPLFRLVHISIAGLPFIELYRFGRCINKAVQDMKNEKVVFIASGDLSHRLTFDAPNGYSEKGPEFDSILIDSLKKIDVEKLITLDESFCESAGECGLRSFIMMFGALDGYKLKSDVLSYEGPFGVGYAVAKFSIEGFDQERKILEKIEEKNNSKLRAVRLSEDSYTALARNTLETYIREGKIQADTDGLPYEMLNSSAGTFVSIKKHGQLRGCIGTVGPTRNNIAEEIIYNAISAGTRDPRFNPVDESELKDLVYSVDVLMPPEPIKSKEELDVIRYGVIVRSGRHSGLLLPNLEGVETPEQQVDIALKKAGIAPHNEYEMERFEVVRHK